MNINQIYYLKSYYKSYTAWWNELKKHFIHATRSNKEVVSAFAFSVMVYKYLEYDELAGYPQRTIRKLIAEMVADFITIQKEDKVWTTILPKLSSLLEFTPITNYEYNEYSSNDSKFTQGKRDERITQNPYYGMLNDGKGTNWATQAKVLIDGYYEHGVMKPNSERGSSSGDGKKTFITKEQTNQQIGRIVNAVLQCNSEGIHYLLAKYQRKYVSRMTTPPFLMDGKGRFRTNPNYREIDYSDDEMNISEDSQKKSEVKKDEEEISFEQWQEKFNAGEAVEFTWDLECWARYKKRVISSMAGRSATDREMAERKIKGLDALMDAFSLDIYIPPLEHYDNTMVLTIGFLNFKKELRNYLEVLIDNNRIGDKQDQIYYCLLGKPGVGKSKICQDLAKALCRTICVISMGGAIGTDSFEGSAPTYRGANWSQILETIVNGRVQQVITMSWCEKELAKYNARTKKTPFQVERIKLYEEWVKEMNDKGIREIKKDLRCKAPIIVFDELEKVKSKGVLDATGKLFDETNNWNHYDKFLEYRINLGEMLFFATMNWRDRVPDFIEDRFDFVDVEIPSYKERILILKDFADYMTRKNFPVLNSDGTVNIEAQKQHLKNKTFSPQQKIIRDKIGDKIIEACITKTWGVRGSLMNMKKLFMFIRIINLRGDLNKISTFDAWDWDSDERYYKQPENTTPQPEPTAEEIVSWGNITREFTRRPELIKEWKAKNFTRDQAHEWIRTYSANSQDLQAGNADYHAWLRDIKKVDAEWMLNFGNGEELEQEYNNYLVNEDEKKQRTSKYEEGELKNPSDYSEQVRKLRYYSLKTDGVSEWEELVLKKKINYDYISKEADKRWQAVLHPLNQVKDWPGYRGETNYYFSPDGSEIGLEVEVVKEPEPDIINVNVSVPDIIIPTPVVNVNVEREGGGVSGESLYERDERARLEAQIRDLKAGLERSNQKIELIKFNAKNIANNKKENLNNIIDKLRSPSGLNRSRQELADIIAELHSEISSLPRPFEYKSEVVNTYDTNLLSVYVVNDISSLLPLNSEISQANSVNFLFGNSSFEKLVNVLKFDESVARNISKITINDCKNLIILDLKGCSNLEKLTFKDSKWESVYNIEDCVKLNKVSIKECEDVSLAFLQGTNVNQIKIY